MKMVLMNLHFTVVSVEKRSTDQVLRNALQKKCMRDQKNTTKRFTIAWRHLRLRMWIFVALRQKMVARSSHLLMSTNRGKFAVVYLESSSKNHEASDHEERLRQDAVYCVVGIPRFWNIEFFHANHDGP